MSNDKKYTVYKHTSPDGKVYIGTTSQKPENRWRSDGSGYHALNSRMWNAINIIGWGNFEHDILASGLSEQEAYDMEQDLILKYNSTDPNNGYNMSHGGKSKLGMKLTDKHRAIISKTHKGAHLSEERKKILSESRIGEKNPMYGRYASEETRRKMSESHKGRIFTEEHRKNLSLNIPKSKVRCVETEQIYDSIQEAIQHTGCRHISDACRGAIKTSGGYHWEYVD